MASIKCFDAASIASANFSIFLEPDPKVLAWASGVIYRLRDGSEALIWDVDTSA